METDRTLIVLPTYNERENIGELAPQLFQIAPNADVLLVDDNSPDGTAMFAEQLFCAEPRFSILRRTGSRSFGRSLLDGYRAAVERGYARLVQMDADFSHEPKMVPALIDSSRDAHVVIGSRYCSGGRVVNWPWHRRVISRFANEYVSAITGLTVRDSTSGFKCYARRALQCLLEIGITSEGYAFQVETVFRAQREGLRIVEIPITFTDRRAGQSKMSGKVILESALEPWRLRLER
jgi:dolichol-phosphate mannosyltransferase